MTNDPMKISLNYFNLKKKKFKFKFLSFMQITFICIVEIMIFLGTVIHAGKVLKVSFQQNRVKRIWNDAKVRERPPVS